MAGQGDQFLIEINPIPTGVYYLLLPETGENSERKNEMYIPAVFFRRGQNFFDLFPVEKFGGILFELESSNTNKWIVPGIVSELLGIVVNGLKVAESIVNRLRLETISSALGFEFFNIATCNVAQPFRFGKLGKLSPEEVLHFEGLGPLMILRPRPIFFPESLYVSVNFFERVFSCRQLAFNLFFNLESFSFFSGAERFSDSSPVLVEFDAINIVPLVYACHW